MHFCGKTGLSKIKGDSEKTSRLTFCFPHNLDRKTPIFKTLVPTPLKDMGIIGGRHNNEVF